ncbi:hypothetical protein ACFPTO_08045 [Paraburkholderia denitrificans]|uniref:Uncharacterized protein n=1 Tax=Paraburkholderia denitrificans TaxID=694025 RepID=A0ABW0J6Y0_9BURK
MAAIKKVKQDILDYFAKNNAGVGHSFNARGFGFTVMLSYTQSEKEVVLSAMEELASEELVEERNGSHFLTQAGYDRIYGTGFEHVQRDILDFFAKNGARVSDSFNARAFMHTTMLHYTPEERHAVVPAMQELVGAGLVEERNGSHFLTQAGFDHIYE